MFRYPSKSLFDFFIDEMKVKYDETDFLGRNPFLVNVQKHCSRQTFFAATKSLLDKGIRFDLPDSMDRTPFLIYYENQNMLLANILLDMGANICQMDKGGLFALKYALIRRQDSEITRLTDRGA